MRRRRRRNDDKRRRGVRTFTERYYLGRRLTVLLPNTACWRGAGVNRPCNLQGSGLLALPSLQAFKPIDTKLPGPAFVSVA